MLALFKINPSKSKLNYSDLLALKQNQHRKSFIPDLFIPKRFHHQQAVMLLNNPAILAVVVSLIAYSIVLRFIKWRKLRHIPGPWLAAWSRLWLLRHVMSGKLCKSVEEVCGRYGEQNFVSLC